MSSQVTCHIDVIDKLVKKRLEWVKNQIDGRWQAYHEKAKQRYLYWSKVWPIGYFFQEPADNVDRFQLQCYKKIAKMSWSKMHRATSELPDAFGDHYYPLLHELQDLVSSCRKNGIETVNISTNTWLKINP